MTPDVFDDVADRFPIENVVLALERAQRPQTKVIKDDGLCHSKLTTPWTQEAILCLLNTILRHVKVEDLSRNGRLLKCLWLSLSPDVEEDVQRQALELLAGLIGRDKALACAVSASNRPRQIPYSISRSFEVAFWTGSVPQ